MGSRYFHGCSGPLTVAMIVTMRFIRENGRAPDLIAGPMQIEQKENSSPPQRTPTK